MGQVYGLANPERIWIAKMCEKSSKMTDFACLGRSMDRFERKSVQKSGFYIRNQIPISEK